MKRSRLLPFVAIAFLVSFTGFKPAEEWQVYTSREGGFSIQFPGKPEESTQDDSTDTGVPFKLHFASYAPTDNEVYMAGWIDMRTFYPEGQSVQQMLENSRDGAAGSMKAKNVTTLATVLTGDPYIEFTFESDDYIGKDRIYLIHKYQYSIITIFSRDLGLKPTADTFIASFRNLVKS